MPDPEIERLNARLNAQGAALGTLLTFLFGEGGTLEPMREALAGEFDRLFGDEEFRHQRHLLPVYLEELERLFRFGHAASGSSSDQHQSED